jgi:murein DD-endopeptidase MepM/ murein hydrolase activator NlpD
MAVQKPPIPQDPQTAKQLRSSTMTGPPLNQVVWDLDRSTPLGTLKAMIRERMSPEVLSGIRVQAMVVSRAAGVPPVVETIYGEGGGDQNFQMIRVRVISDSRHYWMPQPQNPQDPTAGFYPVIKHDLAKTQGRQLEWGQFVEVQFYDNKTQFTSHMEVGDTVSLLPSSYLSDYADSYSDQTKHGFLGANCTVGTKQVTRLVTIGQRQEGEMMVPIQEERTVVTQTIEGCGKVEQLKEHDMPEPDPTAAGEKVKLFWPSAFEGEVTGGGGWAPARTINGKTRPHKGVDIRALWGTPIFAVLDGKIKHNINSGGPGKGFGYYITMAHGKYSISPGAAPVNISTIYAHLQNPSIVPIVADNAVVKKGQLIAISAASGRIVPAGPSGAHLHFEIIVDSSKVDPEPFLKNGLYRPPGGAS